MENKKSFPPNRNAFSGKTGIAKYKEIALQTFKSFLKEDPLKLSSSISYYTILSLPAILIILVKVAGIFFGEEAVTGQLSGQIEELVGEKSAKEIEVIIKNVSAQPTSLFMRIIGIGTLLFSATTVFVTLQDALNSMWDVKAKPSAGIKKYILNRFLSFGLVVTMGFLLLVSLSVNALINFMKEYIESGGFGFSFYTMQFITLAITAIVLTFTFALIFKFLPDVKILWKDVWAGAAITTVLFIIGKFLIGLYLGNSDFTGTYGAAGSLVIIMVWVYYSSLILLLGAEFTQVYVQSKGRSIAPSEYAEKVIL